PKIRVECMLKLGEIEKDLGQYEEAQRMLADALADAEALGDEPLIIAASMVLAGAYRWSGDTDKAQRSYEALVERTADDPFYQTQALSNLAGVYSDRGDYPAAIQRYRQALELAADQQFTLNIKYNLATALHGDGQLAEADALYAEVLGRLTSPNRMRAE